MNKLTKELLKKNNGREKEISDENKEIYTNMIVYLRGSDLTDYNQEVVREDIIELILDGQQRGDNIQKVMGGRYKEICDEIVQAMPKKTTKEKIMELVVSSLHVLWILGVIALGKNLITIFLSKETQFHFVLTLGNIINGLFIILIANVAVWVITKTAFNTKKISFLKIWIITAIIFVIIILNSKYFTMSVMTIPLWLATIVVLCIFIIAKMASKKV